MSWLLFINEPSGLQSGFPYGVLAGFAIEDSQVWPLTRKLISAQEQFFGHQLLDPTGRYLNADALIGAETFQKAAALFSQTDFQKELHGSEAKSGYAGTGKPLDEAALSQAKISYCEFALALAKDYGSVAFAISFPVNQIDLMFENRLRKDYAFLIERFFYFLSRTETAGMGILAIPKDRQSAANVNSQNWFEYFAKTTNGRLRSRRIMPAPFYTDNVLNVISQLTEVLSYAASWAVRLPGMDQPRRPELERIANLCNSMRFSYQADNGRKDWSFKYLPNLRPLT